MIRYIGVKIVDAEPMTRGDYNKFKGWTIPENENPEDEGFLVKYSDDYISWSPKKQFDEAYTPLEILTFGVAVEALKKGHMVAREGWNGKGMYLYYVPANSYPATTEIAKTQFGDMVPYGAYIAMKTAQGNVVPWLASQTDMLSDDWNIVDSEF